MKTPKRQPAKKTDCDTLSKLPKKETLLSGLFLQRTGQEIEFKYFDTGSNENPLLVFK
jgi:hypothetical protein